MGLEELIEDALIREIELVYYLFDGNLGVFQHIFGLKDDKGVDPFRSRTAAYILYELGEILRSKTQFVSIKSHVPLGSMIVSHQLQEMVEDQLGPG